MRLNIRVLKHLVTKAAEGREQLPPDICNQGFVLLFRFKVVGWTRALIDKEAFRWRPGVIAVGANGFPSLIYLTAGGNYDAGAAKWVSICTSSQSRAGELRRKRHYTGCRGAL